jgi:hypothetical protein
MEVKPGPGVKEMMDMQRRSQPSHGCICPPGANLTCEGPFCPRKPFGALRQVPSYISNTTGEKP